MLNELLDAIAREEGRPGAKFRPCEVFDVIAGIGVGGWLALLLGRFQMDLLTAATTWYHTVECIAPKTRRQKLRLRLLHGDYYDVDCLTRFVDELAECYGVNPNMFLMPSDDIRCKHVFVAASSKQIYTPIRTYYCPKNSAMLESSPDPRHYKISQAFVATGAAKLLSVSWHKHEVRKEKLTSRGSRPHDITELALDEVWGLCGVHVPISVIVNLGPGDPHTSNPNDIARSLTYDSPTMESEVAISEQANRSKASNNPIYASTADFVGVRPINRSDTLNPEQGIQLNYLLRRSEEEIEDDIRRKLRNIYPKNTPQSYRVGADLDKRLN